MVRILTIISFVLLTVSSAYAQNTLNPGQSITVSCVNAATPVPTPTPIPTASPTPIPTATPTPVPTPTPLPWGTASATIPPIPAGATIITAGVNGIVGDGTTDDWAGFHATISGAGNYHITGPATYLLNHAAGGGFTGYPGAVSIPSGANIWCDSNVTLLTSRHDNVDSGIFYLSGSSNVAVYGCTFLGKNTTPVLDSNQSNGGILIMGGSNITLIGNNLSHMFGNSSIRATGSGDSDTGTAISGLTIDHNSFGVTGLYGFGGIGPISNLSFTNNDCNLASCGLEPNHSGVTFTGVISGNRVQGNSTCGGNGYNSVFLTGGVNNSPNSTGVTVSGNTVFDAIIYENTTHPANYSNQSAPTGASCATVQ